MRLIAQIPCTFAGKKYLIGEEIPADVVENPEAQAKRGVLAVMNDGEGAAPSADMNNIGSQVGEVKFIIPIHLPDQDYDVSVTEAELTVFTDVLQMGVKTTDEKEKIAEIVSTVESEDLLILMDAVLGLGSIWLGVYPVKERVDALAPQPADVEPETPPAE